MTAKFVSILFPDVPNLHIQSASCFLFSERSHAYSGTPLSLGCYTQPLYEVISQSGLASQGVEYP